MTAENGEKIALVTGSTSGIGRATAEMLGESGYHVVVTGRDAERGQLVCQNIIDANGKADFFEADLTQQEQAQRLVDFAASLGELAVLVNCVGGNKPHTSTDQLFAINYRAPLFVMEAALNYMKSGSSIVNVTSICSESKQAHEGGAYSDFKAAITSATYGLTADLARQGIRINIVAPGLTETPDTQHITGKGRQDLARDMPLSQRFLDPHEVAQVICNVAEWPYVTGQTVIVDGGMTAVNG